MNAALVLLVVTLGFALVVPMVLGVWGNPLKASATRSLVGSIETVAQRATPAIRVLATGARGFTAGASARVIVAIQIAGRAVWLLLIALAIVARNSIEFLGVSFLTGVDVLRLRLRSRKGWFRSVGRYGWSKFRPVTRSLSLRRSTMREPAPSKQLASSRLAFAVIVYGTAFAVLIILTIRWVTAALEGIVS